MKKQVIDITVYDHSWTAPGLPVLEYDKVTVIWRRSAVGGISLDMPYGDDASKRIAQAHRDIVPITATINGHRWEGWISSGKITGPSGNKVLSCTGISVWAILKTILMWPAPPLPLGTQPGFDVYFGNACSAILDYVQRNATRMNLPMVVVPLRAPDTSYLVNWQARMTPIGDYIEPVLKELSEDISVRMWLPGDPPIPGQPGRFAAITPTKPVFVVEARAAEIKSWVVLEESVDGVEAEVEFTTPQAGDVISGGKTNDWLRNLLPGLVGVFNDWFFAYDYYGNPDAASWGNYRPREAFKSAGQAYSLDSLAAGRQGVLDLAGTRAVTLTVADLQPTSVGADAWIGDVIGADVDTEPDVIWDHISTVTVTDSRADGLTIAQTIGDKDAQEDWVAKTIGRVKSLTDQLTELGKGI